MRETVRVFLGDVIGDGNIRRQEEEEVKVLAHQRLATPYLYLYCTSS